MSEPDSSTAHTAIPHTDPFGLFDEWFALAQASEPNDPNAMALATATANGRSSIRMVLLKGHGPQLGEYGGFVFYTNARSRKGKEIEANPQGALLFHWKSLRRQIRIEGPIAEVSEQEADDYFRTRSRQSQLGAAASDQSEPLDSRETYLAKVEALDHMFEGQDVPRPPHWTGFVLTPRRLEFWIDRPGRLHERRQFRRSAGGESWTSTLLYP